jgi:hypothetical protein
MPARHKMIANAAFINPGRIRRGFAECYNAPYEFKGSW